RPRTAEAGPACTVALGTDSGASCRRAYHAALQPELLLELLLTDTTRPRSIAFQLERLGLALDRLPDVAPTPELRGPLIALRSRIDGWDARDLLRPLDGESADGAPTALLEEADAAMATLRELATA